MQIKKIAIEKLKAAEYNPRKQLKSTDKEYQAIKHSLESYGMELDPKYCDVIIARFEKLTNKKADLRSLQSGG